MAAEKLSFGTGGIRGIRGAGPNKFNADVVSRVAEGHARHLKEKASQGAGFMVAYDARHQSKEFAKIYFGFTEIFANVTLQPFHLPH
jgi:phosphomannomutase